MSAKRTPRGDAVRKAKNRRDARIQRALDTYHRKVDAIRRDYEIEWRKAQELPNG